MLEFQEKRKIKRLIYSRITLIFLLVLTVFLLSSIIKIYKKQALTKINLDKTQENFEKLRLREKTLSSEIDKLETKNGIEEEIREKYGLVKPGEEVLVIVDNEKEKNSNELIFRESLWQKMLSWFK